MVYILSSFIFIIVFCIGYLLLSFLYKDRIRMLTRVNKIRESDVKNELSELDIPFRQRIIFPFFKKTERLITKITPKRMKSRIEQYLQSAGKPISPYADRWLLFKYVFGLLFPCISIGLFSIRDILLSRGAIIFIMMSALFLFYFPELYLKQSARRRKKEIEKILPDVLDLLTVSVEAGLSFDSAVNKLVEKMNGVISDEFSRTLHEIRVGKNRKEALMNMSKRCDVSDLSLFIGSLIQADELGIGIANVLRVQSKQMREKRRQKAQEKALKAPVKILFPLIFFIFPTIFVIILGPSIIKFTQLLSE